MTSTVPAAREQSNRAGSLAVRAVDLEWPLVLLATPLLLFPGGWRTLGLLVVPLLFGLRWIRCRPLFDCTPLNVALLALAVMLLISLGATYSLPQSLPKIAGVLLGFVTLATVVAQARSRKRWQVHLAGLLLAGVGVAALGLLGSSWNSKSMLLSRLTAALPQRLLQLPGAAEGFHPNEVAGALLWVAPLALWAAIAAWSAALQGEKCGFKRFLLPVAGSLIALFLTGTLILTQSRTAWIALAATTLGAALLLAFTSRHLWPKLLVLGMTAGLILAAGWVLRGPDLGSWSEAVFGSQVSVEQALSGTSLRGRVEIWSRALYGIDDFPLTGMGMNTFRQIVPVLYPLFTLPPEYDFGHAHNEFLQAALDLGLPGLIAFAALNLGAAWMLIQSWRRSPTSVDRLLVLGLAAGLLAHALYGMVDTVALGAKPGVFWWALLGLIASKFSFQLSVISEQPRANCDS